MNSIYMFSQLILTIFACAYFFMKISQKRSLNNEKNESYKDEAERNNRLSKIHLTKPLTEKSRPKSFDEIVGQKDGVRALLSALSGNNPQHIIIYGPAGVGKTAAARLALEYAKKSKGTPFLPDAPFVEVDSTIVRFDERSIADSLIGSVHDPIYQGAGNLGVLGIPEPKEGAVTKAHGGVLFLDEIGELHPMQMNKLLKVLEDGKVILESSYYNKSNKNIPLYVHEIFKNGLPADFRLIGATTRRPCEIPDALRSRCVEVYFNALSITDIRNIIKNAVKNTNMEFDDGVLEYMSLYAKNGRDAVKMVESAVGAARLDNLYRVSLKEAKWVIKSGRYKRRQDAYKDDSIINISLIK